MSKHSKKRLDELVCERYPTLSRTHAQSLIMQGKVTVDGQPVTKSGTQVVSDVELHVDLAQERYVSRAGYKLERALEHFDIDVNDLVVMDAGISTGGFTDCLLQHGAKRVYGVDVGYAQVHEKIRHDQRVILFERTNVRSLAELPEKVDLVTLDLSFISVLKVMDTVVRVLKPDGQLIVLIKPQFEAARHEIGRGGIVKDPLVHDHVVSQVTAGIELHGFQRKGLIESPIRGGTGNKEFLAWFVRI